MPQYTIAAVSGPSRRACRLLRLRAWLCCYRHSCSSSSSSVLKRIPKPTINVSMICQRCWSPSVLCWYVVTLELKSAVLSACLGGAGPLPLSPSNTHRRPSSLSPYSQLQPSVSFPYHTHQKTVMEKWVTPCMRAYQQHLQRASHRLTKP